MTAIFLRLAFSITFAAGCTACVSGQQSLFQSASGDSTIYLPQSAGVLSYNLGSDQARFDLQRDFGTKGNGIPWSLGGGFGGTIKNGSGNVINKSAPANGGFGEVGASWRFKLSSDAKKTLLNCVALSGNANDGKTVQPGGKFAKSCHVRNGQFVLAQFHYGYSAFSTITSAASPVPPPTQLSFNQLRGTVAINFLRVTNPGDWRVGIAYVPGTANNLTDLKQQTYQTQVISTSTSSQSVLSQASQSVYVGSYKTYLGQQINLDGVFQPTFLDYRFAVDMMLRSDLGGGAGTRYASPGLGFFFFTKGKPVVPVVGVSYTYKAGNNQLAVSAGWSFGGASMQ